MDTSKEYVNMCRKATEIQKHWNVQYGDFVYADAERDNNIMTIFDGADGEYGASTNHISVHYVKEYKCVWLPRQDQLQEISGYHWAEYYVRITNGMLGYETPEQSGLALIMMKQHSKKWNGSEWVEA